MNRNQIIALVVAGLVLVGGGFYLWSNNSSDSDNANSTSSEETAVFSSQALTYPVTMTGTVEDSSDPQGSGTIVVRMQSETLWSMELSSSDGTSEIVYASDATYMQNPEDGSWLKLPASDTSQNPAANIIPTDEDFLEYEQNATFVGSTNCAAGTCETWEWQDPADPNSKATLKLNNNRIIEVEGTDGSSTIVLVYDYDTPVNIEIPTEFIELPTTP